MAILICVAVARLANAQVAGDVSGYRQQLHELALWCEQQGLKQQARQTREWLVPRDPLLCYVFDLPEKIAADQPGGDAPAAVIAWHGKFRLLREEQAQRCFAQARQAVREGQVSLAFALVGETLHEDPDHAEARRLLGYQKMDDHWQTAFTSTKKRLGQVWDERFGWIPKAHLPRYEAGERFYKGRWISAEQDARVHSEISAGWGVESEHFTVTTNHSLRAAADLAAKLQRHRQAWQQVCAAYIYSSAEAATLFEGGRPTRSVKRHQVVYLRNQDEFKAALRGEIPENVNITGIYLGPRRTAYFYAPAADSPGPADDSTLHHEATHQLFGEARNVPSDVGREANFWIIEGIACYFESLQAHPGFVTVAGSQALRFRDARHRLLQDEFYVPLAQLTALGMKPLQRHPQIARLYTQAAGLTHFLMHDQAGRYRDSLMAYLNMVYSGRDRASSLVDALGVPFDELDRQYRLFMEAAP